MSHALFSPSGSSRWLTCPGSVALELECPEQSPSIYAIEGSRAHLFCDRLLRVELRKFSTKSEKERIRKNILKEITDDTMRENVLAYVAFCMEKREKLLKKHGTDKFVELIEEKIVYDENLFGTADYALVSGKIAMLVDYKNGSAPVAAEENTQLKCYCLCLLKQFPEIEKFVVFIVQPNCGEELSERFDILTKDLKDFEKVVTKSIKRSLQIVKDGPSIEDVVEGDHCKYCRAFGICPIKLKLVEQGVELMVDETIPTVTSVNNDAQLLQIWNKRDEIKKFMESLTEYMFGRAQAGNPVPGTKIVQAEGRRGWSKSIDEEKIAKELKKRGVKNPWNKKLIGLGDAEKALKKTENKIDDLVSKGEGSLALVDGNDPRPAYKTSHGEVFEDETKTVGYHALRVTNIRPTETGVAITMVDDWTPNPNKESIGNVAALSNTGKTKRKVNDEK